MPNILSLSRLVIAPFLFIAIKENNIFWIITLSTWAMLSDYLDGLTARRLNLISNAGKILDPLGDKVCIAAAAIAVTLYGEMPPLLLVLIVARDLGIGVIGITIIKKVESIPVSNIIGKYTALVLALVLLVYVFRIEQLYKIAYIAALLFITLSGISYIWEGQRLFKNKT